MRLKNAEVLTFKMLYEMMGGKLNVLAKALKYYQLKHTAR